MADNVRAEYDAPDGSRWKVERPDLLKTEFGAEIEQLAKFHVVVRGFERGWKIVRLLYGIAPIVASVRSDADYLQINPRWQVAQKLNVTTRTINQELAGLKAVWQRVIEDKTPKPETDIAVYVPVEAPKKRKTKTATQPAAPVDLEADDEMLEAAGKPKRGKKADQPAWIAIAIELPPLERAEDQELLETYGFNAGTFGRIGRDITEATAERDWFIDRLRDMQKLFDEPKMVSSLARMALINEMQLRRLDAKLCMVDADHWKFAELQEVKQKIEEQLEKQWTAIKEVCPWAVNVENKISFAGVISDLTLAYRDFVGCADNRRVDGLFTNFEIQCQMREAVQHPIRYRYGQVVAIREAIEHLWEPDWKRGVSEKVCKTLDAGFIEGVKKLREECGMDIPDLEKEGPQGEYPPLWKAESQDADQPNSQPQLNVEIDLKQ